MTSNTGMAKSAPALAADRSLIVAFIDPTELVETSETADKGAVPMLVLMGGVITPKSMLAPAVTEEGGRAPDAQRCSTIPGYACGGLEETGGLVWTIK